MRTLIQTICLFLCLGASQIVLADEAAEKLLSAAVARAKTINTLTAHIELSRQAPGQSLKKNVGTVSLLKPNLALIELSGDYPLVTLASDGRSRYLFPDRTKYSLTAADSGGENIDTPWWAFPVRFFYTQSIRPFGPESPPWKTIRLGGSEVIDAKSYDVIEIAGDKPMSYVARYYFDSKRVLCRSVVRFGEDGPVFIAQISQIDTSKRLGRRNFRFKPPLSARLDRGAEEKMLALGAQAPDFSLPTPEGTILRLETTRQGKKAILINFWYLACPPCRAEFEVFQRLYTNLKDDGFSIVAINNTDTAAAIRSYARDNRLTFSMVMAEGDNTGVLSAYLIQTYPSTYLLNSEGKVVYKAVGVDEAGLLRALKELGFQPK
jgi:peroxiredoxin